MLKSAVRRTHAVITLPPAIRLLRTLQFQALSYYVIIVRSGEDDDANGEEPTTSSRYSLGSLIAAVYLLVQTASPDLRAGFSLLVDGASFRLRVFGAAMLAVFGLLVTAAMKVIFSSADNDADVVAEAVTALFIADLVRGCPTVLS